LITEFYLTEIVVQSDCVILRMRALNSGLSFWSTLWIYLTREQVVIITKLVD